MRLALLVNSLPPRSIGGAELQAHATAVRLAARGHRVVVFARAVPGDRGGAVEEHGVRWVRAAATHARGLSFFAHLGAFLRDWRRERDADPQAVLAYQLFAPGLLGALAARDRGIPLVAYVRSEVEIDPSLLKYRILSPWVLRRSRIVLAQSPALAGAVRAFIRGRIRGDAGRRTERAVRVLANAVDVGPEPPAGERRGLVFLGRLVSYKGLDVLLRALRRFDDPPPLRVIGDGPLRSRWEAEARGLPVTFLGAMSGPGLRAELEAAAILVSPSRSEGFPNALLEAMERAIPVVATAVGAVPDVVTDGRNGLLVPPGDDRALHRAVSTLLGDDDLRRRLSAGGRATAAGYGWEAHLDALEAVLEEAGAEG